MSTLEAFYDINPVARIDQNQWDDRIQELVMQYRQNPTIYTPLIEWTPETQMTSGARTTVYTEMLEGDTDIDEIPMNAYFIDVTVGMDSRSRTLSTTRYGDKIQLHKLSNLYQRWVMNGSRDWRPLLQDALGRNFIRKHELLSRNAFLMQPSSHWTFAGGATSFADIGSDDTFDLDITSEWHFRLGNTGSPIVPGDVAAAKLAICPPGAIYAARLKMRDATNNEASLWRDARIYSGQALPNEIGELNGVRFQQVPSDNYGENMSILYNAGAITVQYGVIAPIQMGDGSPDPEVAADKVDSVWSVGQKDVTHYIQLEAGADTSNFALGDIVTIHTQRTADFGVTGGVEFRSGKTVNRRIVKIDATNKRLSFDRPVMFNYTRAFNATPTSTSAGTFYAFVTKARHVGFTLVMGSRGGIMGKIDKPVEFYDPKPVDDQFSRSSLNTENCWDARVTNNRHNVAGNGKRDGSKKVVAGVISSRASLPLAI